MMTDLKQVYSVNDIMTILDISKNTAYDLVKQEDFPAIRIKNIIRIPKNSFEKWLDRFDQFHQVS